jgi:hypothetical protein
MPLLAYCLAEARRAINVPLTGVQDAALQQISEAALQCFISDYRPPSAGEDQDIERLALAFHRVLKDIFGQVAIIPFRFPTLLQDESEVRSLLRERSEDYSRSLARLRDSVQMEVQLRLSGEPSPAQVGSSGARYLRERQERRQRLAITADELRRQLAPHATDWLQRETAQGLRCYALTQRSSVPEFLRQLEHSQISSEVLARATGPWPTTEFLKEK